MNVKVRVYDECKYSKTSEKIAEVEYYNIRGFEVMTGDRAAEIANETDADGQDEYNEYLVIELENGETATFRNSHVDLFRI